MVLDILITYTTGCTYNSRCEQDIDVYLNNFCGVLASTNPTLWMPNNITGGNATSLISPSRSISLSLTTTSYVAFSGTNVTHIVKESDTPFSVTTGSATLYQSMAPSLQMQSGVTYDYHSTEMITALGILLVLSVISLTIVSVALAWTSWKLNKTKRVEIIHVPNRLA